MEIRLLPKLVQVLPHADGAPLSLRVCALADRGGKVGDGLTAYEAAEKDMSTIRDLCSGLPATIADAVRIILQGSPREVERLLPIQIESALKGANACMWVDRPGLCYARGV